MKGTYPRVKVLDSKQLVWIKVNPLECQYKSLQMFTAYVHSSQRSFNQCQCISCSLLCGAFAFAPPTCHPSAIALAPLPCDIKNFRSVRSHCQTHSGKTGLELCPAVKNACCSGLEHRCLSLAICVATSLHVELVSATSLAC